MSLEHTAGWQRRAPLHDSRQWSTDRDVFDVRHQRAPALEESGWWLAPFAAARGWRIGVAPPTVGRTLDGGPNSTWTPSRSIRTEFEMVRTRGRCVTITSVAPLDWACLMASHKASSPSGSRFELGSSSRI